MRYLFLFFTTFFLHGESTLLMEQPDIYGNDLVFEYGGDLWSASITDKMAHRLTSHEAYEVRPEFSPDGKWIAFSGQYYTGDYDVYVMPRNGGEPKRLTYHPGDDYVIGWARDGEDVLFISRRGDWKQYRMYKISIEGGLPEKIPLPAVYEADMSPDGKKIVFNRGPARLEWKGYKGGRTPDIWFYDSKLDTSYKILDWKGTEVCPQWVDNKIFFIADKDGRMNIYVHDLTAKETKQITQHDDFEIQNMNRDDSKIVYSYAGEIYLLNCATYRVDTVSITVSDDRRFMHVHYEGVSDLIESYNISPTGKRAVFEARGDIFTVPKEKGSVNNITKTAGIRERYPVWSYDKKYIAFFSDKTGENELYIKKSDGSGESIQITDDADCYRFRPVWAPDSKKILYSDTKNRLHYVDIQDRRPILVDTSPVTGIYWTSWSSDSRWISYIKFNDNWFGSIYIYSLNERKVHRVTSDLFHEYSICFDPSGKYLYFISSRTFDPIFGDFSELIVYPKTSNICLIPLQEDISSPFLPESDDEIETEAKDDKKAEDKKEEEAEHLRIDFENIEQRIISFPLVAGAYAHLSASEGKVLYLDRAEVDFRKRKYDLHCFALKEREDKVLIENINDYELSSNGESILYKSDDTYGIIELADKKYSAGDGKLKIKKMEMKIDRKSELKQLYVDAWRLMRDFYYDPDMHGLDWNMLRKRYAQFLPHIADRDDLTRIIRWLYSELGGSHAYVWSGSDKRKTVDVGLLGAEFELDKKSGFYKFKKIFEGESWKKDWRSPLTEPGTVVNEGEFLISIEDQLVKYPNNPYQFLENTSGKQIKLKVAKVPLPKDAREINIKTISFLNERRLYYLDWVETNRKKVEDETDGRVGYIHVPNTHFRGWQEFGKYLFSQASKDGLIIDVRYNSGGWSPLIMLNYLHRKPLGMFIRRAGQPWMDPSIKFADNQVCIINEYAGSGGDMFPYYFRELGLGPLIGKTTWGGLISTSGRKLMDGGGVATPVSRFKDMTGVWRIENEGVAPDIPVEDHPHKVMRGYDPQLEKAIEVIKKKL